MKLSVKVMRVEVRLCLLVATLALGCAEGAGLCERGRSWWHRKSGTCLPCTRCDPAHFAVKYPCEVHRDTVCQPLYEVRIFPFNVRRRNNGGASEQSSDYEYYEYSDYGEVTDASGEVVWDVQASTLALAVGGCVVFFVVVLVLSLYHAKQWRALKQALKSDVQDLSAKLKLMESGGESPTEQIMPTDHHIYCNIHVGKEALLGTNCTKKGLGNVYTQEKLSSS
ncbi:unnamed protein product, partial [Iphiclides podalirius]